MGRKGFSYAVLATIAMVGVASCSSDKEDSSDTTTAATAAPVTEAPVTEAPVTEAPVTEAPTTDAPTTEAPTTDAPTTEAPTTDAPETTAGEPAEAQEFGVQVDGRTDEFNASFFAYFPDTVTVHPGDTVIYESVYTGEPHSITFGTAVQEAVEGFRALTPEQLETGDIPPELDELFNSLPAMLPEGPGDANQVGVNPCFVAEGEEIPADPAVPCDVREAEPFTGTEVLYNSGFLEDSATFEMQISEDTEPGTYIGFCLLHFVEMTSTIEVVAPEEEIPTPDEVAEAGLAQLEGLVESVLPAYEAMQEGPPGHVFAGGGDETISQLLVEEFIPAEVEVAAGEAVTWTIIGPHTISFNAPEDLRVLITQDGDGLYHLNEGSVAPAGYAPPEGPPPEGDEPPPPIDAGTFNGEGFFSSGLMFGGDFMLTFDTPGSYEYICLIHPDMEGVVNVS